MPAKKIVKISKRQEEIPGGLPTVLGLNIINLIRKGYRKFIIEDYGDVIIIETWRLRRDGQQAG